jgi:hypothetical protein
MRGLPLNAHSLRLRKLVERIESLVQAVEYPILAQSPGEAPLFQVGLQVRLHMRLVPQSRKNCANAREGNRYDNACEREPCHQIRSAFFHQADKMEDLPDKKQTQGRKNCA